jgi:hypothetical protein
MSFLLCYLKMRAMVLRVCVAIFLKVTLTTCTFGFSRFKIIEHLTLRQSMYDELFFLEQLPKQLFEFGLLPCYFFSYISNTSLHQSMLMEDRHPASSDALKSRTTFKSDKKGWVWKKKGDETWGHWDTPAPVQPPHRVGLARQLQVLAFTNSCESTQPPLPK